MAQASSGLDSSIWAGPSPRAQQQSVQPSPARPANANTAVNTQRGAHLKHSQALRRFEQACRRVRWKFIDLQNAWKRANEPGTWEFSGQDAERNFKVDFYEFYAWIEQAVVLLLTVFGTTVEGARDATTSRRAPGTSAHAYHHNVLKALDDASHPLNESLGRGDVRHALWQAKELRNRWKDAADGHETPPLRMYDLSWIVTEIMNGLDAAYKVALARVNDELEAANVEAASFLEQERAKDGWDWMVDPMDWES